jgi:hypothetical protein
MWFVGETARANQHFPGGASRSGRFAKGRNPRLMPEWDVSVMTCQPSLSILAMCRSIVCIVGKDLCR